MSVVRKLDEQAQFAEIKTGLKTTSGLKRYEIDKYNSLFNQFREQGLFGLTAADKGKLSWVADNLSEIEKYVKATYIPPKYKPSTLRGYLEALANILLAIDKDKFKEVVRPMFNTGLSTQQLIDKATQESKLSEQEQSDFVTFPELVKVRDLMHSEWLKNPNDLKLNMYQLILAVNTYIPPLRLDWVDMNVYPPRLLAGKPVPPATYMMATPPPINKMNYLWEQSPGHWAIVINHDKIEGKREKKGLARQVIALDEEIPGVTNGKRLSEIINKSLEVQPRNFVLIGIKNKGEMSVSSYDAALATMFRPRQPRQNLLRKAYINYWHSQNLPTGKLNEIAFRMRHTLGVAMGSYRKINIDGPPEFEERKVPEPPVIAAKPQVILPIQPPTEVKSLPILPPPPVIPVIAPARAPAPPAVAVPAPVLPARKYFSPAAYAQNYRVVHADTIKVKARDRYNANSHKILRNKILSQLNKGVVTRPTAKSIELYGLRQDAFSGLWISTQPDDEVKEAAA